MNRKEARKIVMKRHASRLLKDTKEAFEDFLIGIVAGFGLSVFILPHLLMVGRFKDSVGFGWKIASGIWLVIPFVAILAAMAWGLIDWAKGKIDSYKLEIESEERKCDETAEELEK